MTWAKLFLQTQTQILLSRYSPSTLQLEKKTFDFRLTCSNSFDKRLTHLNKIRNINLTFYKILALELLSSSFLPKYFIGSAETCIIQFNERLKVILRMPL